MPFVALPFGIKVEVKWTTNGGIAVCIHFLQKNNAIPVVEADLLNAWNAFNTWRTTIRTIQPPSVIIQNISATDWSSPTGEIYAFQPNTSLAGTLLVQPLPDNVAMCVTHDTLKRGRSFHGRTYIPGLTIQGVANGDILSLAQRNTVLGAYDLLVTTLGLSNLDLGIASFVADKAPRVTGVFTKLSASTIDQLADSQRRRLLGRGQ